MIEQVLVFVENLAFVSALRNSTLVYPLVNAGSVLFQAKMVLVLLGVSNVLILGRVFSRQDER